MRLAGRAPATAFAAGNRCVDNGSHRDARVGRSRRVSRRRRRSPVSGKAFGSACRYSNLDAAQHDLAPMAVLCDTTPLGLPGPSDQPLASEGEHMSTTRFRVVDSPVGPLTLAGRGGTLTHLRMEDQTHEPDRAGWERDDNAFPDAVEQLAAY